MNWILANIFLMKKLSSKCLVNCNHSVITFSRLGGGGDMPDGLTLSACQSIVYYRAYTYFDDYDYTLAQKI